MAGRLSSAVDLVRGLGVLTGIEVVDVPGATAGFDNDYTAQCDAALASLADRDLFLLHVEATDEAGHQGAVKEKVSALERWDEQIIGPLVDALQGEHYRVLLLPDHATPCALRTHTSAPVPYLLFDSQHPGSGGRVHRTRRGGECRRSSRITSWRASSADTGRRLRCCRAGLLLLGGSGTRVAGAAG